MLPHETVADGGAGRTYGGLSAVEREERARAALLDAGTELFADNGFAATGVRELCRAAKVSERTFYATVGSREVLLRAVYLAATDAVIDRIRSAMSADPGTDVYTRLRTGLGAFFDAITDEPRHGRLIYVEALGRGQEIEAARREGLGRFVDLVLDELRPFAGGDLEGPGLAAAVAAALTGVGELAYRHAEGELVVDGAAVDRIAQAVAGMAVAGGLIAEPDGTATAQ